MGQWHARPDRGRSSDQMRTPPAGRAEHAASGSWRHPRWGLAGPAAGMMRRAVRAEAEAFLLADPAVPDRAAMVHRPLEGCRRGRGVGGLGLGWLLGPPSRQGNRAGTVRTVRTVRAPSLTRSFRAGWVRTVGGRLRTVVSIRPRLVCGRFRGALGNRPRNRPRPVALIQAC